MNHIDCIENKNVTASEMEDLLKKSRDVKHPYYYRFSYDTCSKTVKADRIKKTALTSPSIRRQFHTIDITAHSPLRRAFELIESKKQIILKY